MARDDSNWRDVGESDDLPIEKTNPLVSLLRDYGIPHERLFGQRAKGDVFTGDKSFRDYRVELFGVSSDEKLPHPQLVWNRKGKEFDCWRILIHWKDYYGWIDATWREDYDNYDVV